MTTHELANLLLLTPNVMVTRSGYEGGVEEIKIISEPATLYLNVHEDWWYGSHEYSDSPYEYPEAKSVQAIHLD